MCVYSLYIYRSRRLLLFNTRYHFLIVLAIPINITTKDSKQQNIESRINIMKKLRNLQSSNHKKVERDPENGSFYLTFEK